jgi:hypothetical protein
MADKFWVGELPDVDDFEKPYTDVMYDGKTKMGYWANMNEKSWKMYGCGQLGTGYGQKYRRTPEGNWIKVAG